MLAFQCSVSIISSVQFLSKMRRPVLNFVRVYAVRSKNVFALPCIKICNCRLRPFSGLCMVITVDKPMNLLKDEWKGRGRGDWVVR
jgi:hypothetical protein